MKGTIHLTVAQALIRFLNQQYICVDGIETPFIEGFFTVFGHGNVLGIGEALQLEPGHLKHYQGKNEQGMTHAAVAYSRQKNRHKIFAVTASSGPGSANMITAAATALANNIPVLLLPADTFASRQPDPVLQQFEQENSASTTTNDAFRAVSRYWDRIQRPEQLMSALIRAFEVLTNPAIAGPVTICLPQDVEAEAFDYPEEFFKKRVHYINRTIPTKREINSMVTLIQDSQKPVILVGGGARYSGAREELMILSKQCNIPLVETHAGKSTVESTFEQNLGGAGILGTSAANKAILQADLIIGIGTRYTDFTTASKTIFDYDNTKFINININRFQAYKMDALAVVGDAKATLETIIPYLKEYKTSFGDEIVTLKQGWLEERKRLSQIHFDHEAFDPEIKGHFTQNVFNEYSEALGTDLSQTEVFIQINDLVDDDAVAIASAGSLPGDMQRLWISKTPETYHMEYGYSCMGYEVAGALGVKMAVPNQEVYAMLGDGSFQMLHSELVTSLQYGYKINVMVFDNAGFGCINNLQMDNGNPSYGTELRDANNQIMQIDYAQVAQGYGAKTYRVKTLDELKDALQDAKKQTKSTVFDIKILPKTMTDGYDGSWWNVGIPETSQRTAVIEARRQRDKKLADARKY